ncbi:MAG: hypothetical protein PHG08_00655 [Bacilli bacterium]|nr:hypothetical protein [Bacilli bacterium]
MKLFKKFLNFKLKSVKEKVPENKYRICTEIWKGEEYFKLQNFNEIIHQWKDVYHWSDERLKETEDKVMEQYLEIKNPILDVPCDRIIKELK